MAGGRGDERVQVALAEFGSLRDEIIARTNSQHTLVSITFTVAAAVLGFAAQDSRRLLVLPLVVPALGMFWFDHARAIDGLGDYIRERLRTIVVDELGADSRLLGYELWLQVAERQGWPGRFVMGVPLFVLYVALPAVLLVFVWPDMGRWLWVLWGAGAAFVAAASVLWGYFLLRW